MKTFNIEGFDYEFRIRKMSAIEVLAFQTQIRFDSLDKTANLFSTILESIEVRVNDQWLPVKMKGRNVYCPAEAETNVKLCDKLIGYFMDEFLGAVFPKSDESNQ